MKNLPGELNKINKLEYPIPDKPLRLYTNINRKNYVIMEQKSWHEMYFPWNKTHVIIVIYSGIQIFFFAKIINVPVSSSSCLVLFLISTQEWFIVVVKIKWFYRNHFYCFIFLDNFSHFFFVLIFYMTIF